MDKFTKSDDMSGLIALGNRAREELSMRVRPLTRILNGVFRTSRSLHVTQAASAAALGSAVTMGAKGVHALGKTIGKRPGIALILAGAAISAASYWVSRRRQQATPPAQALGDAQRPVTKG